MNKYLQAWATFGASMVVTALVGVFAWLVMQSTAPLRDALAAKGTVEQVMAEDGGNAAGDLARQARAILLGIVTVVIFVAVARLILRVRRAHGEALAAEQLRQLGGQVVYDFQTHKTRRARQFGPFGRLTAGLLARWVPEYYLGRIVSIDLAGCEAGDDQLSLICGCQQLETLDLSDTQITVGALHVLSRLSFLETLGLHNLEISTDDVRALTGLRRLRQLEVTDSAISRTAAAALESLPRLSLVEHQRCCPSTSGN